MKVVKSLFSKSCLEHIFSILCPVTLEQYSQGVREWKTCIVLETNFLDEGSRLDTLCLDSMSVYIFSLAVDLFLSRTSFTHKVQEGTRSACDDLERELPPQNKLSEQPYILMAFPDRKTFSDGHHLKDDII